MSMSPQKCSSHTMQKYLMSCTTLLTSVFTFIVSSMLDSYHTGLINSKTHIAQLEKTHLTHSVHLSLYCKRGSWVNKVC